MSWLFHEPLKSHEDAIPSFNYIDLVNITGLSAAVRNGKTVGFFSHGKETSTEDSDAFIDRLNEAFPTSKPILIYFPLTDGENINAVCLRRRAHFNFPASSPVIQVCPSTPKTLDNPNVSRFLPL